MTDSGNSPVLAAPNWPGNWQSLKKSWAKVEAHPGQHHQPEQLKHLNCSISAIRCVLKIQTRGNTSRGRVPPAIHQTRIIPNKLPKIGLDKSSPYNWINGESVLIRVICGLFFGCGCHPPLYHLWFNNFFSENLEIYFAMFYYITSKK